MALSHEFGKGGLPLAALDVIERAELLAEVKQLAGDGDGGLVAVVEPGSSLARMLRQWPDAADELAGALGERSYYIETLVVRILRQRGYE